MKTIFAVTIFLLIGSAPAFACAFSHYRTLERQIADDINAVYNNEIDTTCSVAEAKGNRFRCSVACIDFKANFTTKADREQYISIVTAATQKSLGEVVSGDFITLSVMDGYMSSKNTAASVDLQKSRKFWLQVGNGSQALTRFRQKLRSIIQYEALMKDRPQQPLD